MPTFSAIVFDRLIEPGASKTMAPLRDSPDLRLERRNSAPNSRKDSVVDATGSKLERGVSVNPNLDRRVGVPPKPKLERGVVPPSSKLDRGIDIPSTPKLDRRNSVSASTTSVVDNKHHWTQISPALYATPESTPLPDSPSSFPPSPYIINHKRRGPRLMKCFSEDDVVIRSRGIEESKVDENGILAEKEVPMAKDDGVVASVVVEDNNFNSTVHSGMMQKNLNGGLDEECGSSDVANGSASQNGFMKSLSFTLPQDEEVDDFVDPQDSMSVKSVTESEGNVAAERSFNSTTPIAEFYDAWEELSSENGPQLPLPDIENELREIRLGLLMEIEKRKQAEENLHNMRSQWKRIREQLSLVGLTLPEDPILMEGEHPLDSAVELSQQVYVARFVSNSIGRGIAKAEVELEMETQMQLKNFEIARLWDRLHYYEAVNQEMSQRNQEVVETARRLRQRRKRRQRWVWGSIAAAATLGSAVLAYSYFRHGKGISQIWSPSIAPPVEHKQ